MVNMLEELKIEDILFLCIVLTPTLSSNLKTSITNDDDVFLCYFILYCIYVLSKRTINENSRHTLAIVAATDMGGLRL